MLVKKRTLIIALLIVLAINFPNVGFGQGVPSGSPEARALELFDLLGSVEGVAEEPPRVFRTADSQ